MTFKQRSVWIVCAALAGCVALLVMVNRSDSDLRLAHKALGDGRFADVIKFAESAYAQRPGNLEILDIGADAAEKMGDTAQAIDFLDRLPAQFHEYNTYSNWIRKSDLQLKIGRVSDAHRTLQTVVDMVDDDVLARRKLATLLSGCGYRFESLALWHDVIESGSGELLDAICIARNGRFLFGEDQLQRWHSLNPKDPMPIVGLLAAAWQKRDLARVTDLLSTGEIGGDALIRHRLRLLLVTQSSNKRGDWDGIDALARNLEKGQPHPESLMLLSEQAILRGESARAARCLYDAIQLDPWNTEALHAMAESVRQSQPTATESLLDVVVRLRRIEQRATQLQRDSSDISLIQNLAVDLQSLGRISEAVGWARIALQQNPHVTEMTWAHQLIVEGSGYDGSNPFSKNKMLPVNLVRRPADVHTTDVSTLPSHTASTFRLDDEASDRGIDFRYDNGVVENQQGLKMHQWTGGGVAVLDLDADLWPDLYFTQGGDLHDQRSANRSDQLFRNVRGGRFEVTTAAANVHETQFGQGVAAGDVNNDGFDDLYIANAGHNRLLINQGDGTFIISASTDHADSWTTSVAISDLDGDGQPDLFDVNYLAGDDVFVRTCDHQGKSRICGPTDFPAAADVFSLSDATGNFQKIPVPDVTSDARGMGLVIGDICRQGANWIYVANDESANQLWRVGPDTISEETAFLRGVALNQYGQPQGSMGIALGDYNRNGRPDLFVSNYYAEANTLYSQVDNGVFVDKTASSNLSAPSFAMLGFGCQFIDVDCDGNEDLVVANGHLDDFSHLNHPYQMLPQCFQNTGHSTFVSAGITGNYFQRKVLGRALAKLDWNRDGRCDFAVTHLDQPAALITNSTVQVHATTSLRLIGTHVARIPVGAYVEVSGQTSWLTAGDGYQCSNEKQLQLSNRRGLPSQTVKVHWPGRPEPNSILVTPGISLAIVEGRPEAYVLPE